MINLLSAQEQYVDEKTREFRFNIDLLTKRLVIATDAITNNESTRSHQIGYFAASTGTSVAINAALKSPNKITTIVSRSGRTDLVGSDNLGKLRSSVLLIVGSLDISTLKINQEIICKLPRETNKKIIVIPGASHLFEEKGKIEQIGRITSGWFKKALLAT